MDEKRGLSAGGSPLPHPRFPAAAPVGVRWERFAVPLRAGSLSHSCGRGRGILASLLKREKQLGGKEKRKKIDQIDATKTVVRLMGFTPCLLGNGVPRDGTDPVLMLTYARCVQTWLIWADKPLFPSPLASPQSAAAPGAWQCRHLATPCMGRGFNSNVLLLASLGTHQIWDWGVLEEGSGDSWGVKTKTLVLSG